MTSTPNPFRVYSDEQTDWLKAIDEWRRKHGRPPTLPEAFRLAISLGYRKANPNMIHTLTIPDYHPPKLNELLRGGHWGPGHKLKMECHGMIAGYAIQQGIPKARGKRLVGIRITLAPKQRAGDPDAYFKATCDSLAACGLLLDDNRQNVELSPVKFDRGPSRMTTITLEDL